MLFALISLLSVVGVLESAPQFVLQTIPSNSQQFATQTATQQQPTLFIQALQEDPSAQFAAQTTADQQQFPQLQSFTSAQQTVSTGQEFQSQQLRDPANPTADVFVHSGFPLQGVSLGATGAQSPFQLQAQPFARVSINSLQGQQQQQPGQFQANLQHQLQQQQQLQQLQQQQIQQQQIQHQQLQQPQQQQFVTSSGQTFTIPTTSSFTATSQQAVAPQQTVQTSSAFTQPILFQQQPQQQQQQQLQAAQLANFRSISTPTIGFITA